MMGGRLKTVVRFALALALSFLVATSHLFVLLNSTMSFIHLAVAVVRRAAATVGVLAIHGRLLVVSRSPDLEAQRVPKGRALRPDATRPE